MARLTRFLLLACLLIAGCANSKTLQIRDSSADGTLVTTVTKGPNGEDVTENWDSKKEYEDCLSTVNRRRINGMTADAYCREQTRSNRRRAAGFGTGSFGNGFGPMSGGWGDPRFSQSAPPIQQGGPHYTQADPNNAALATATPVYATGEGQTPADDRLMRLIKATRESREKLEQRVKELEAKAKGNGSAAPDPKLEKLIQATRASRVKLEQRVAELEAKANSNGGAAPDPKLEKLIEVTRASRVRLEARVKDLELALGKRSNPVASNQPPPEAPATTSPASDDTAGTRQ
jgi:BMFP domain-containing protein YqiC